MNINVKKIYLTLYRMIGIIGVIGVTVIFLFYGITFLFFGKNKTWVAPTVVTNTDDRELEAQAAFITQKKIRDDLIVKVNGGRKSIKVLKAALLDQNVLLRQYNEAIKEFQQAADRQAKSNVDIHTDRVNVIADMASTQKDLRQVLKTNDDLLAAGLITRDQYIQTKAQIFSLDANLVTARQQGSDTGEQTDILNRQIQTLSGNYGKDIIAVDVLNRRASVISQIGQLNVALVITQQALTTDENTLKDLSAAINSFSESIYGKTIHQSRMNLVFVPYENSSNVHPGDPAYSCAAVFFWCSRVGTIGQKFDEEKRVDFPVLNIRFTHIVRGNYFEFKVDKGKENAMQETLLFVGSAPLLL